MKETIISTCADSITSPVYLQNSLSTHCNLRYHGRNTRHPSDHGLFWTQRIPNYTSICRTKARYTALCPKVWRVVSDIFCLLMYHPAIPTLNSHQKVPPTMPQKRTILPFQPLLLPPADPYLHSEHQRRRRSYFTTRKTHSTNSPTFRRTMSYTRGRSIQQANTFFKHSRYVL